MILCILDRVFSSIVLPSTLQFTGELLGEWIEPESDCLVFFLLLDLLSVRERSTLKSCL